PIFTDCAPLNPAIGHNTTEDGTALSTCFDGIDNDCDGIVDLDCAVPIYAGAGGQNVVTGSVTFGSVSNLTATSANNTYEALTEGGSGSARQLKVVWTVQPSPQPGTNYDLRVEGFRNTTANDTFNFSFSSRVGTDVCTSSDGGTASILSVSKTSDDNQLQVADLGTASDTYCVKVVDSKLTGDSNPDTLTLDRLFAFPTPVALSDYAAAGDVGTVILGTSFESTQLSDNTRETLREELSGGAYRLWHTWSFQNVPAGTSHKLHLEGYRAVGPGGKLDDFQFYWSTNPSSWSPTNPTTGFTLITGGIINTTSDVAINSSNFGPGTLSGTVYIRVIDAQKAQT